MHAQRRESHEKDSDVSRATYRWGEWRYHHCALITRDCWERENPEGGQLQRVRDDNEWINEYWYLNTVSVLYNQEESGVKIFFMKGEMLQYSVRENV